MKFKWIIVLFVLLSVGAAIWWVASRAKRPAATADAVRSVAAQRGDIRVLVEATGSIESNLDVDIKCKASGEVVFIQYDVSNQVPQRVAGQNEEQALLVRLNPIDEQRSVQRAEAQQAAAQARVAQATENLNVAQEDLRTTELDTQARLAGAEAKLALAKLVLERKQEFFANNAATRDEVDTADIAARVAQADVQAAEAYKEGLDRLQHVVQLRQADVTLAKADLARAEVDLADARQRLTETQVYSPISGVVTSRDVEIGQIVASGIVTVGGGTKMMTVSDLSRMFVVAAVDESDIGRLVETGLLGQSATITADTYPARQFQGKVVQITPRGKSEANVVTFAVKIEILDKDKHLLLPKMTADVEILAHQKHDVLLVPLAAVRHEKDGTFVDVRPAGGSGQASPRQVRLGITDGVRAEVLEGLTEGELVEASERSLTVWSNEGKSRRTTTAPAADGEPNQSDQREPASP